MDHRNHFDGRGKGGYYVYYPDHEPHDNWMNQTFGAARGDERSQYHSNAQFDGEASSSKDETAELMRQFLNENGQLDVQKTLNMVSQFADTVDQVTPVVKQLNDVIKGLRK